MSLANTTTEVHDMVRKKTGQTESEQVAFRFPRELIERIDRHVERMAGAFPGLEISRADAVRSLLTAALDSAEAGERPSKKK